MIAIKTYESLLDFIYKKLPNKHEYKERVGELHSSAKKMANTVDNIINLLKLEPITKKDLSVNALILQILSLKNKEELASVIEKEDFRLTYKILKKTILETKDKLYSIIKLKDVPTNYDTVLKKIGAIMKNLIKLEL